MTSYKNSPDCIAVNLETGTMLLDTNEIIRIEAYFDEDGDKIDDPFKAVACVAQFPDNTWYGVDLTQFKRITIH